MRIEFLGTAASEGFPDPFCRCFNCEMSRDEGGKSLRLRSSAIINDELIIDLGPDVHAALLRRGRSIGTVRYALQTHPHSDHLEQTTLFTRKRSCQVVAVEPMDYFCSSATIRRLDHMMMAEERQPGFADPVTQDAYNLRIHVIDPWKSFEVGPYDVLSVKANHDDPSVETMLYAIRERATGAQLFYGTDTGSLPVGTWDRLAEAGWIFDSLMLDFTFGFAGRSGGHMNHEQALEEMDGARAAGALRVGAPVYATHIAHHSNPAHSRLVELCTPMGIEVAYDGLVVDVLGRRDA